MVSYDVAIVGAGPAGSTAAFTCAKQGLKTLVIEAHALPRFKPCGGGLSVSTARLLDFPIDESVIERRCRGIRFLFRSVEKLIEGCSAVTYMVTRSRFDQFLLEKAVEAGAVIRQEERFLSLDRPHNGGVVLSTDRSRYRASLLIGADGALSRVRRFVDGGLKRKNLHLCAIAEVPLNDTQITSRFGEFLTVHFGYAGPGYAWLFPKSGAVSAGIGIVRDRSPDLVQRLRGFLKANGLDPHVPVRGCFVPHFEKSFPFRGDRVLLAGDAAGFVDAFTGEGIKYALLSGRAAGGVAVHACGTGDFSPTLLKSYDDTCRDTFGDELELTLRIRDLLFGHGRLILGPLLHDREALAGYLDVLSGTRSLREYVDWVKKRMPFLPLRRMLTALLPGLGARL